ncbi:retrovirus-related pol polyprotein from transposon TNT 1-94 [Tanacetum coccineum]
MGNNKNVSQDIRDQLNAEAEAVQIILTGIDNDIYSTVDACPNACEMWKAIERLKQGNSVVQKSGFSVYNARKWACIKSKAYRVFNKRTRMIVETIHVNFDELPQMASDHSSAVHAADNPDKRQQHNTTHTSTTTDVADPPPLNIHSTHQTLTQVPTVTAPENIIQAETNTENAQFDEDEFINIFSTPLVRTRHQLETDGEMCMFALTVSQTEPKNIKESMADSAWIESMQEELHQFDRLDVWELVDRPLYKNVINLK